MNKTLIFIPTKHEKLVPLDENTEVICPIRTPVFYLMSNSSEKPFGIDFVISRRFTNPDCDNDLKAVIEKFDGTKWVPFKCIIGNNKPPYEFQPEKLFKYPTQRVAFLIPELEQWESFKLYDEQLPNYTIRVRFYRLGTETTVEFMLEKAKFLFERKLGE